ncbi:MAG TPA: ROK family protein [Myxococcota bacterium]|nr:ROK family protein [Myxococcota bacterium]
MEPPVRDAALLGIDLGGTKVAFALGDAEGRPLRQQRRPTEPSGDPAADVARIAKDAAGLIAEARAEGARVQAVGVSVPGPFDPDTGTVLRPPNLPGWDAVPLRDQLAQALGLPIHLENDANAAALAEWRFGAGRGARHVVYLTMSTGVGGGLVLDGRLYRGVRAGAGELGHVQLVWEGDVCSCGLRGCAEAYLGGASLARRLRAIAQAESRVAALAGGKERITARHLVAAAREGDAFALAEMARYNHHLGRLVAITAFAFAPEVVVLGTIPTAAGEALCFDPVRRQVAANTWPQLFRNLRIVPAALGGDLAAHAALAAAWGV